MAKAANKCENLIPVTIPFVEGQDPEETIIINGKVTKIKKGVEVWVKPNVAKVVKRANKQAMIAKEQQEKMKLQRTDV